MKVLLLMMMGLPFSGKSTIAKRLGKELDIEVFSYDNDVYSIHKNEVPTGTSPAKEFDLIESIAREQISRKLKSGLSLIYDDLCLEREDRQKLTLLAEVYNAVPVLIFMDTPLSVIEKRRKENIIVPNRSHLPSSKLRLDNSLLQSPTPAENAIVVTPDTPLEELVKAIASRD